MHRAGRARIAHVRGKVAGVPISIAAMRKTEKQVVADTPFGEVRCTYRPAAIDDDWSATATALAKQEDNESTDSIALLLPLLASWDIEEDGKPYPISTDTLLAVGPIVRNAVMQAIQSDAFPNAGKDAASS